MESWPRHPVPVFPLPNVVLFPHVEIPLHVFELRYRTMVRDALSKGRWLAMALLLPGWEADYQGSPEFHSLVCLGRIAGVEWLPDDCYDLTLQGLTRARVKRVAREFPYRAVTLEPLPQHPYAENDPLAEIERSSLLPHALDLAQNETARHALESSPVLEAVVNLVCTYAPMDPPAKLALLEEDSVIERARRIREWLAARPVERGPETPEPPEAGGHN